MDFVAKGIYKLTYDRIAYEPIREDFIAWYINAYEELSLDEQMDRDNGEIVNMALEARSEALRYEPDSPLNTAIKVTSEADAILKVVSALLSLLGISVGLLLAYIGILNTSQELVSIISGLLGGGVLLIPGSALPFYLLLKYTVETNGELIRLYNEELVVSIGRIRRSERWDERTTAFYIHHSSLCSTTQLPVIVFLGVLRVISPATYGIVSQRLRNDISDYQEDSFWKILGKEYARVKKEIYPRTAG